MNAKLALDKIQYLLDKYEGAALLIHPYDDNKALPIRSSFKTTSILEFVTIDKTLNWFEADTIYIAVKGLHPPEDDYDGQRGKMGHISINAFTYYRIQC